MKTTPHDIPAKWTAQYRMLVRLRQRLDVERGEHDQAFRTSVEKGGSDTMDLATDRLEHDVLFAALSAEDNELAEIEAAIERMRQGTYGICAVTGKPIGAARLRALPWTRYSQEVAERREAAQALHHDFLKV